MQVISASMANFQILKRVNLNDFRLSQSQTAAARLAWPGVEAANSTPIDHRVGLRHTTLRSSSPAGQDQELTSAQMYQDQSLSIAFKIEIKQTILNEDSR